MRWLDQAWLTLAIWGVTTVALIVALVQGAWTLAFVSLATLVLGIVPVVLAQYMHVVVPRVFLAAVVFFVFATLFLGEVFDFYERFWWWDLAMHGASALGFGLILWAALHFRAQDTTVHPRARPTALVATGPYRLNRNPMYTGMALILID